MTTTLSEPASPAPTPRRARPVARFAAACGAIAVAASAQAGFVDLGNGVVRDDATGLEWLQDADGIGGPGTWYAAATYADTLAVAGGGWRMPDFDELTGLYAGLAAATGCVDCRGDIGPFQDIQTAYWSTLEYYAGQEGAVYVGFLGPGSTAGLFKSMPYASAWAVREAGEVPEPGTAALGGLAVALATAAGVGRRRAGGPRPPQR